MVVCRGIRLSLVQKGIVIDDFVRTVVIRDSDEVQEIITWTKKKFDSNQDFYYQNFLE